MTVPLKHMLTLADVHAIREAANAGRAEAFGTTWSFAEIERRSSSGRARCRLCGEPIARSQAAVRFVFGFDDGAYRDIWGWVHHSGCVGPANGKLLRFAIVAFGVGGRRGSVTLDASSGWYRVHWHDPQPGEPPALLHRSGLWECRSWDDPNPVGPVADPAEAPV